MKVYGEARLARFAKTYAASRKPLERFLAIAREATWKHLTDVKASFPGTDYLPESQAYIFNIGGNKYRLQAGISFVDQVLSVESIMTHEQYNR